MVDILYWQKCLLREESSCQKILQELRDHKKHLELQNPEKKILEKLASIDKYQNTISGLLSTAKHYKVAVDNYFISSFGSYCELIEEIENLRWRSEYLCKIINTQRIKLDEFESERSRNPNSKNV